MDYNATIIVSKDHMKASMLALEAQDRLRASRYEHHLRRLISAWTTARKELPLEGLSATFIWWNEWFDLEITDAEKSIKELS